MTRSVQPGVAGDLDKIYFPKSIVARPDRIDALFGRTRVKNGPEVTAEGREPGQAVLFCGITIN